MAAPLGRHAVTRQGESLAAALVKTFGGLGHVQIEGRDAFVGHLNPVGKGEDRIDQAFIATGSGVAISDERVEARLEEMVKHMGLLKEALQSNRSPFVGTFGPAPQGFLPFTKTSALVGVVADKQHLLLFNPEGSLIYSPEDMKGFMRYSNQDKSSGSTYPDDFAIRKDAYGNYFNGFLQSQGHSQI